jgi:anti-anti-sigma factor
MSSRPVRSQRCELLSIQLRSVDAQSLLVRPHGEIDLLTAPLLEQVLDHQLGRHPRVVLDLVDVRYFGGCGLRVLERAQRRAQRQGAEFLTIAPAGHVAIRMAGFVGCGVRIRPRGAVGPDRSRVYPSHEDLE